MIFSVQQICELIAVITSIAYVILAGKNKMISWLFAIISSSIYVFLNFEKQLYFFTALQFFYVLVAIYGWIAWKQGEKTMQFKFIRKKNVFWILVGSAFSISLAFLASKYTAQSMPYLDAFNFVFCLMASWMISRKIMEAWIYLIFFDLIAIYINFQVDLYLTAGLYLLLSILGAIAFHNWYREFQKNQKNDV